MSVARVEQEHVQELVCHTALHLSHITMSLKLMIIHV